MPMPSREQHKPRTSARETSTLLPFKEFELRPSGCLLGAYFFLVLSTLLVIFVSLFVLLFCQHTDFEFVSVPPEDLRIMVFVELFGGVLSSDAS